MIHRAVREVFAYLATLVRLASAGLAGLAAHVTNAHLVIGVRVAKVSLLL